MILDLDPRVDAVAKLLKSQVNDGMYFEDAVYVEHAREILDLIDNMEDDDAS